MTQGHLSLVDPELDRSFNEFCRGIRVTAFRKLLLLLMWARVRYKERKQSELSFDEFLRTVSAEEVSRLLGVSRRTACDYLRAARLVAILA